jgi:lipopolysaccharide export system permease protein
MKIYDWYIIRKFLMSFSFMLGIIFVLVLMVDTLEKLDLILEKKPPFDGLVFEYYANLLPFFGIMLAPICVFLAVIFFTSQMAQRTEIVPMLSAGVSFYRIALTYFGVSLLLAAGMFYAKGYYVPHAVEDKLAFEVKYLRPPKLAFNSTVHKKVAKDTYFSIGYYDHKEMEGQNFTLEQVRNGDIIKKIYAERIYWVDSTRHWLLKKGRVRIIEGNAERIVPFAEKDTTFLIEHGDIFVLEQKQNSLTNTALQRYITLEEMRGSDILPKLYEERHRRYADPLAIVILTIIGFAMSSKKSRGGIALQIGLGMMLCFGYIVLLVAGVGLAGDDYPVWVGVWAPNVLFAGVAALLLRVAPK